MFVNYMDEALVEARKAFDLGEVPVGAVVVDPKKQEVVARAHNENIKLNDATAHAEILAIRRACANLGKKRLDDLDLYVTLEPCAMCASAISHAKIKRLYFAASDKKHGVVLNGFRFYDQESCFWAPEIYNGIAEDQAIALLSKFFEELRN